MISYIFQVLIELMKKRERDLSNKTIFELGEGEEGASDNTKPSEKTLDLDAEALR